MKCSSFDEGGHGNEIWRRLLPDRAIRILLIWGLSLVGISFWIWLRDLAGGKTGLIDQE